MNDELFGPVNYAELRRGGAPLWAAGIDYVAGDVRRSTVNHRTYVRKAAGAGNTDPSGDGAAWELDCTPRPLRVTRLTAGAGNFVKLPESSYAIARLQGAGAHGTSGANGYVNGSYYLGGNGGNGGGAGMHLERRMVLDAITPFQVGAAGTTGGATVFGAMRAPGGRVLTGNNAVHAVPTLAGATQGGIGGPGGAANPSTYGPGSPGVNGTAPGSNNYEFSGGGLAGRGGIYNDPAGGSGGGGGGGGGDSPMGRGGSGAPGADGTSNGVPATAGEAGQGYGAGGGGGGGGRGRINTAGAPGGAGRDGCIEIEEY